MKKYIVFAIIIALGAIGAIAFNIPFWFYIYGIFIGALGTCTINYFDNKKY